jgi:hypothetical protein
MAKRGQAKESLDGDSTPVLLKRVKQFIRCDWGSKPSRDVIRKKMAAGGVQCGERSIDLIVKLIEDMVDGCRKRTTPYLNEVIGRVEGKKDNERLA